MIRNGDSGAMDRQPKLTPRTKDTQVAPEATEWTHKPTETSDVAHSASVVPLPEETVGTFAEKVERVVRSSGQAALKDSILLYFMLLVPLCVVSILMFSIFATLSWLVPNVLCRELAIELSVSSMCSSGRYHPKGPHYYVEYTLYSLPFMHT